jgi:hypothetical protein
MAAADYRLCDVCRGKAFYDANLNYEIGSRKWNNESGKAEFSYPENPYRQAGNPCGNYVALDRLGDWAVLCLECSKTHKTQIARIEQ